MRSPHERLRDILEAIDRIERYPPGSPEELAGNDERQVWYVHNLQIIGEAARSISQDVRQQMPDVPWRQWVGLRHILVHEYFGIDVAAIHNVVVQDLAVLRHAAGNWLLENSDE